MERKHLKKLTMTNHIKRLEQEKTDLLAKLTKLREFLQSDNLYNVCDETQFNRLSEQEKVMAQYLDILNQRIEYDSAK